jgi:hypothetical protein
MPEQRTIPMLSYEDPIAAEWLERAFGFRETGGFGTHVNLELNGDRVTVDRPSTD